MAEILDNPFLRRLRYTPIRDLLRGRISGRLDLKAQIDAADLPTSAKQLVARVVRRAQLWPIERADVADDSLERLALLDGLPELLGLGGALLLHQGLARDDEVPLLRVALDDEALEAGVDEGLGLFDAAQVDLAHGHEASQAADFDGEAALVDGGDLGLDDHHFAYAGPVGDGLGGPFLVEDEDAVGRVEGGYEIARLEDEA